MGYIWYSFSTYNLLVCKRGKEYKEDILLVLTKVLDDLYGNQEDVAANMIQHDQFSAIIQSRGAHTELH